MKRNRIPKHMLFLKEHAISGMLSKASMPWLAELEIIIVDCGETQDFLLPVLVQFNIRRKVPQVELFDRLVTKFRVLLF